MGTNVIHLADWAVPSYRRNRAAAAAPRAAVPADRSWSALARQRAVQRHAADLASVDPRALALAAPAADTAAPAAVSAHDAFGPRAVRVTHLQDARPAPGASGRLRISGRLIDVCAELDRLAAAEAQAALPRRA